MSTTIESRTAQELSASVHQVAAAVALLDEGATVPFISRYRKEATGGLDDTQLRNLQERLIYLRELEERRMTILTSIDEQGLPTVRDIFTELEKPARDPRPEFKTAEFKDGIEAIKDLRAGMILEGTVTNVTNFGAFVDIGVHQDGLVHISVLSNKFVKDPHEIVKAGQVIKVKVLEIDEKRKRVALTMRLEDQAVRPHGTTASPKPDPRPAAPAARERSQRPGGGAMAEALAQAFKHKK